MKTRTIHFVQRGLTTMVFAACLSLAVVADAEAHKPGYRQYVVHQHYVYYKADKYPLWLQRDYEFQRWFVKNQFRLNRNLSWQRRYEIFRLEKPVRLHNKLSRGRVIYDTGHRTYWNKPLRRW